MKWKQWLPYECEYTKSRGADTEMEIYTLAMINGEKLMRCTVVSLKVQV